MVLKKLISYWLMPLPLCLLLLVVGWWLFRSPRRARLGRGLLGAGILLLLLCSNKVVSTRLIQPLESHYAAIPELAAGQIPAAVARCRYFVVLGSGNGALPGLSATSELAPSATGRLVEALRLLRAVPQADLIVSGPATEPHPSHARVLADAAVSLGFARERIHLIDFAHDTEEESVAVRAIARGAPVGVVTSAWHMPRSMALFRRAGVDALACPADYAARPAPEFHWDELNWDVESLGRSTAAVHERLGLLWLALKER